MSTWFRLWIGKDLLSAIINVSRVAFVIKSIFKRIPLLQSKNLVSFCKVAWREEKVLPLLSRKRGCIKLLYKPKSLIYND